MFIQHAAKLFLPCLMKLFHRVIFREFGRSHIMASFLKRSGNTLAHARLRRAGKSGIPLWEGLPTDR